MSFEFIYGRRFKITNINFLGKKESKEAAFFVEIMSFSSNQFYWKMSQK
jgi:hypothetical protein